MSLHKNWAKWWDGLRSKAMFAGATSVYTQLTSWLGSNAVESLHIPGLQGVGENWRTAVVALFAQFIIHVGIAASDYVRNNPDPPMDDTTFTQKPTDQTKP